MTRDINPYSPYVPNGTRALIIGSIPPHRFCVRAGLYDDDVDFYYGSKDNHFWRLLAEVYNITFRYENTDDAVGERKVFLRMHAFGITDIVDSCTRYKNRASDTDLHEIAYRDIVNTLLSVPTIHTLIYTSTFVKQHFSRAYGIQHTHEQERRYTLEIANMRYNVYVLYSPSPQALRGLGKNGRMKRLALYKRVFLSL